MPPACRRVLPKVFSFAIACSALLVALVATQRAEAQQRTFYLDRLQIGDEPEDGFAVWRPRMKEKTMFFGQMALGYSLKPLRGSTVAYNDRVAGQTPDPVNNQLNTYLSAGMELMNRASLAVTLPVTLFQNGGNPCEKISSATCQTSDPNSTVPGDLRLDARLILHRSNNRKFHLGMAGSLFIPSGDDISYTSDAQTTGRVQVLSELDLSSVQFTFNTGVQFRPVHGLNQLRIGNEWTWAGGVFIPLRDGRIRLGGELFGSTGLGKPGDVDALVKDNNTFFTKRNTPLEWLGEIRIALDKDRNAWFGAGAGTRLSAGYGAPNLRVLATVGYAFGIADTNPQSPGRRFRSDMPDEPVSADRDKDGIPDDIDLCPDVPEDGAEPDPHDGCPAPPDRDGDGIPDESDKCPDQPEDKDGIDDIDGCPEDDFDQDGVPDASDACPREPGQPSPEPDKNGCPQFIRRVEGSTEIQILKKVEFATNSATILPRSYPILDEVVRLLKANPDIKRVAVQGHTDSRGSRELNARLSQARADSVMRYLTEHGIAASRLEAKGYGPDKPIDTNDTDEGRQRNRRVEFHILEQSN